MNCLRALCCSKGDNNDPEGHDAANRPVQMVPEKGSHNGENRSASVNAGSSSTNVIPAKTEKKPKEELLDEPEGKRAKNPAPRDLWKEAFDGLSPEKQKYIPASKIPATDAIEDVIKTTTQKYEEWQKGGLRVRRKGKEDINLRDVSESIIWGAMKAKDIISTIVSFDPTGHGKL